MSDSDDDTMQPIRNITKLRQFLIRSGVLEPVLRVVGELYAEPDRPEDAIRYIRNNLSGPDANSLSQVQKKLDEANEKMAELEEQNAKLKADKNCGSERKKD